MDQDEVAVIAPILLARHVPAHDGDDRGDDRRDDAEDRFHLEGYAHPVGIAARVLTLALVAAACAAPVAAPPLTPSAPPSTPSPATPVPATASAPAPRPVDLATPTVAAPPGATTVALATPRSAAPGAPASAPAGSGTAAIPPCAASGPLFDTLPMRAEDFLAFRPLGWTSPTIHVFPAKHGNFALALPGQTPPVRPVVSPGRVWVTEINSTQFGPAKTGYGITFYPCREFKAYFGHLSGLSQKLLGAEASRKQCSPSYQSGDSTVTACRSLVNVELGPGEPVGSSGDAAGVDFGAIDFRITMHGFAEPKHYCVPQPDGTQRLETCELLYYVSPVPYFRADARMALEAKLGSYDGTVRRTAEPRWGEYMQDRPGAAQGNWFLPGKDLSVAFLQPDEFVALVHDYVDPAQPIFSVGTTLRGVRSGVYTFTPRTSGQVDRDFADVRPGTGVFCYEGFRVGATAGRINTGDPGGIVLADMPSAATLRLEKQGGPGSRCGAGPWSFTSAATTYNR